MRLLPRRLTAVAGIAVALTVAAGPVASAVASTPGVQPVSLPIQTMNLQIPFPSIPEQPAGSCQNQGLFPGIPNLGPTGLLGPLGPGGLFGGQS